MAAKLDLGLSPSTNCLQRSFIQIRSPRVPTPRRIKQLSDIDRITSGSTFSSANRSKSVPRPSYTRMDSIFFSLLGARGNQMYEEAWDVKFLQGIVGIYHHQVCTAHTVCCLCNVESAQQKESASHVTKFSLHI